MSADYTKDKLAGDLLDAPNPDTAAKHLMSNSVTIAVGAAGTAATPLAESEYTGIPYDCEVIGAVYSSATAIAADAANTATFVLSKYDASGANKTTVASRQTITGNAYTAKSGFALNLSAGNQFCAANGCWVVEVTKQASGVATGAGNLTVYFRRRNV